MASNTNDGHGDLAVEAIAHFVEAIALLLFAAMWGTAAVLVANFVSSVTELALLAGGIGALILVIMAISAYVEGSRSMKVAAQGPTE